MNLFRNLKYILILMFLLIILAPVKSFAYDDEDNKYDKANWARESLGILDRSGTLKIPDWIDYNSIISQKDYSILLATVTRISDKNLFGDLDINGSDKSVTRGMAIDSAIKAFGLEREVDRKIYQYKSKFIDLDPDQKYYKASLAAEILKISAGYPDKTFRPNDLLKWSEAIAIIESVYRLSALLPVQTPIQRAEEKRQNIWFYFIDGFRLFLTVLYCGIAFAFLIHAWKRSKRDRTGIRPIITSLTYAILFLFIMWLNEVLYNNRLIDKSIYYVLSMVSILAGIFLIKTASVIKKKTDPKPNYNIEVGYVDYVDISRGEIFITDSVTKRRVLGLFYPDTKIYNRENRLLGSAFFSELAVGDFISVKGTEQVISGGSIINIDMLLILASKQSSKVSTDQNIKAREKQFAKPEAAKYKRVVNRIN